MTKSALVLPFLLGLSFCDADETLAAFGASDTVWRLQEINGVAFEAKALVTFPEPGKIQGEGPCNSFFAQQTAPYPWFKAEAIGSTRRACPDLQQETEFFTALEKMTLAEVSEDTLILSDEDGGEMVFQAQPSPD